MTWNYRIIDHGDWLGLHEVHYDEAGVPRSYTADPVSFVDSKEDGSPSIVAALQIAVRDAETRPALKASDFPAPDQ